METEPLYFRMDGHKFVIYLPEDKDKEVNMTDVMRIPLSAGTWEPNTTKIVKHELKKGQTAIDIGTSIGYFTMLFSRQVGPTGKVLSVEQGDMQYLYMTHNVKVNGYDDRVIPCHNAAWNKDETMILPIEGYKKKWRGKDQICKGRRVDSLLKEHNIKKVDFIKIDIDGAEPWALQGLEETFKNNPQLKMVIEYYPEYIDKAGGSLNIFWDILEYYFYYKKIPGDVGEQYYNLYCTRNASS